MQTIILVLCMLLSATSLEAASFGLRIVNGANANIADFPFMVSVQIDKAHHCGGSILNERYILTAAHCVDLYFCQPKNNQPLIRLRVKYGVTHVNRELGEVADVRRVLCHNFTRQTSHNDLAIIEVTEPITFGPLVQPVKLPSNESLPAAETQLTVLGWGYPSKYDYAIMETLQKAQLYLYSDDACEKAYQNVILRTNRQYHICAGVAGKNTCHADSGGPLVLNGVQYGVVSFSYICGMSGHPGVFVRLPNYLSWIKSNTLID